MAPPISAAGIALRTLPLALAGAVPQAATLVVVSSAVAYGFPGAGALVSLLGTVMALSFVSTVGVAVCTIRDLARATARGVDDMEPAGDAVRRNLRVGNALAVAGLLPAVLSVAVLGATDPEEQLIAWAYFAAFLPALLLAPASAVANGAFQFLDRGRENLASALVVGGVHALTGAGVFVAGLPPVLTMIVLGGACSVATASVLAVRFSRLSVALGSRLLEFRVGGTAAELIDRIAGSIDGAVFMGVFLLVQLAASAVSVTVADSIALTVAVVRTVVVPLKLLGVTAARLEMRASTALEARSALRLLLAASAWFLCPAIVVLLGMSVLAPLGSSPALTVLVVLQLAVEPLAGVLFGYLKICRGPRAGVIGLVAVYLVAVPLALLLLVAAEASAEGFWAVLLAARAAFAAANVVALVRPRALLPDCA